MGFFSSMFGGGGNVQLESASATMSMAPVSMGKKRKKQRPKKQAGGKENGYSSNSSTTSNTNSNKSNNSLKKVPTKAKKGGWGRNKNKKKNKGKNNNNNNRALQESNQAPKLSVFLQQAEQNDDQSLNHTIDTGSLTASLTTASLVSAGGTCPKSGLDTSNSDSSNADLTHPYVRALPPPHLELYQTRPKSAAGEVPPPLHESFPMEGVTELSVAELSDSNSAIDALEALETIQSLSGFNQYHDLHSESPTTTALHHPYDSVSVDTSTGGSAERSDGTESTVEAADLSPNNVSPLHKTLANSTSRNNRVIVNLSPPLYHDGRENNHSPPSEDENDHIDSAAASLQSSDVSSELEDEDEKYNHLLLKNSSKVQVSESPEAELSPAERAKSILARYRQQREELQKKSSQDSVAEESLGLASTSKSEDESSDIINNIAVSFDNSSIDLEDLLADADTDKDLDNNNTLLDEVDDDDGDFLSAVGSEHAIDSGSIGDDSANADLSHDTSENLSLEPKNHQQLAQMEFDLDFILKGETNPHRKLQEGHDVVAQARSEAVDTRDDVESEIKVETKTVKTEELHKSFEDIIREVEETIANSQKQNSWISNGLLQQQQEQDDASTSQNSAISFNSDDFKEDEIIEDSGHNSSIICHAISTIVEEHENEDCDESHCPIDAAMERGKIKSHECNRIEEGDNDQEQEIAMKLPQTAGFTTSFDSYEFREDEIEGQKDAISDDSIDAVMERDDNSLKKTAAIEEEDLESSAIMVSANSFTSDEFREDEIEETTFHSSNIGPDMSMTVDQQTAVKSNGPVGVPTNEKEQNTEMGQSDDRPFDEKVQDQSIDISPTSMDIPSMPSYATVSANKENAVSFPVQPSSSTITRLGSNDSRIKSALLCKKISKPVLKKTVSWKDETDVFTYLPPQAQDLQKARDLVATYEKIMNALNTRRPDTAESKSEDDKSSSSDADLSETSGSSIDSLLSILSEKSSESMKEALGQIAQETAKMVSLEELGQDEEHERARTQLLENSFLDICEANTSSSSIESLLSVISNVSSNSNQSMKQVVKRLKEEAETRVIFCSKQLEAARMAAMKKQDTDSNDSSLSSSSASSSLPSTASSTGTSESVKALMTKLKTERSRQAEVFTSTRDMFSLLKNKNQKEEARVQIVSNNWIDGLSIGSSSSLSSLLSASPNSSLSTTESSESVQYMMRTLKSEKERHRQRRNKIRSVKSFVDSMCCFPSTSSISGFPDSKKW